MPNIPSQEAYRKVEVRNKCWEYLLDNFHKFTDTNKIKIAISLVTKDMPTKLEGEVKGGDKVVVYIKEKETKDEANKGEGRRLPASVSIINS